MCWICVSEDFDVCDLAGKICNNASGEKNRVDALQNLRKRISGKRYLLVLDDVWIKYVRNKNVDKWGELKTCLQDGGAGSVVLITTREREIAKHMGTVDQPHDITKLNDEFIKKIIENRAFGSCESAPNEEPLRKMVDEFVVRCVGSPLAAKALGSVLGAKKNVEDWKFMLSQSSGISKDTGIFPILKLSYDGLPSHMKQCFAFCAMFPKDYVIDVDMLIRLWMANGFIPEHPPNHMEKVGKETFDELASRSFFQDLEQVPPSKYYTFLNKQYGYCSKTICKIHDLMHDVALSVMGSECVTITKQHGQREEVTNATRYLLFSSHEPEAILNEALKKGCPAIQTLLSDESVQSPLQHSSKYRSLRALQLPQDESAFMLKPKHLQHLRYLDLSGSKIRELPRDISILHHLQTLDLSNCMHLGRLPNEMKFMISLRHLYTDGCIKLKCMPPDLGKLTSLQTLTFFVVGARSDCSNIGQLQHLNLGGRLTLSHLENVTETDVTTANLINKKELTRLVLTYWEDDDKEVQHYQKVLKSLEPHNGLQALKINGSRCLPTWIDGLQNMVELGLSSCEVPQNLPPLWKLPQLRVFELDGLKNLQYLCSGEYTSSTFPELKVLRLYDMPDLESLGGQLVFPKLEELDLSECKKLTALSGIALLGDHTTACSESAAAFPKLKELRMDYLPCFKSWGVAEETYGEQPTFPSLESVAIFGCTELKTLPKTPQLHHLTIFQCSQQLAQGVYRYNMGLLSRLILAMESTESSMSGKLGDGTEEWDHEFPLTFLWMKGCDMLFRPNALALWACFEQLQTLHIEGCDVLVHWPEREFESLAFLKSLYVVRFHKLTGYAQPPEPSTFESRQLLPRLESLVISSCKNLVEVIHTPANLKCMTIAECPKVEFIFGKLQEVEKHDKSAVTQGSGSDAVASTSIAIPKLSMASPASANHHSFPCLEYLDISNCNDSWPGVLNLPPSLKELSIWDYNNLQALSGSLDALQRLTIQSCSRLESLESFLGDLAALEYHRLEKCESLASLPDNEQGAYSSLQKLTIQSCPRLKMLPRSLQQRLGCLEYKYIDPRYEGPKLLDPKSWKHTSILQCMSS